jgi:hypothetical protein
MNKPFFAIQQVGLRELAHFYWLDADPPGFNAAFLAIAA